VVRGPSAIVIMTRAVDTARRRASFMGILLERHSELANARSRLDVGGQRHIR